ncbi:MBL fold metallo-hydrolase [Paenibacillus soyae]|uniref:MBL fold metallo-hydrolase n=1 Tax=Paenibacillus soyae TaxID=2969249 RepID=A0A9X2MSQ7_9BACL|nr:MBL fold metallo-hydrolase [Paenibacillus soyae]MCR2805547.1 MBL fold metallo-hydrolase [Paenibacillus soyae]
MRSFSIISLPISAKMMNRVETIYPTLLWDEKDVILIDTAYPGQLPLLRQELEQAGIGGREVTQLILTHQDLDHIGSAQALKEWAGSGLRIYSHPLEKPYIEGQRRLLKLTPGAIEAAVQAMPDSVPPEWKEAFRRTLEQPPRVEVDHEIGHLELLPLAGGLRVLETPGHTPGHISLYHAESGTLIAGDALQVVNDQLELPDAALCTDFEQAVESLRQLLDYEIQAVFCHHGGAYRRAPRERIRELIG